MTNSNAPSEMVQENLDHYNQRDIEGFMNSFSDNIAIYSFGNSSPTAKGLDEVRKIYTDLFEKSPNLNSVIKNRIVFDNKVIDHELITGRLESPDQVELVLIYEVKQERISKITVIRQS